LHILYNIVISLLELALKFGAQFDSKLRQGYLGRKQTFERLAQHISAQDKVFWFHCASLGEFEQGLPVFEALKQKQPDYKVVLSFFSPSGYEVKKNSTIADVVVYLPIDSRRNAKKFMNVVHPDLIVFVKYEIWINYLFEIKNKNSRAILISALFRDQQIFFKWYGGLFRKALTAFNDIFVQNLNSQILLESIGIKNCIIAGDTRFDRVLQNKASVKPVKFINEFINGKTCVVIGSSWPEDEKLLARYINQTEHDVKFILVPHNVDNTHINQIKNLIKVPTVVFSEANSDNCSDKEVMIIDQIGLLRSLYNFGHMAYVGGAMGKTGLHNILEPAVFGIPIVIGKNFEKFPEAKAMIKNGGVISIDSYNTLSMEMERLLSDENYRRETGKKNTNFVTLNSGAVQKITNTLYSKT
jgi:3-deoxy-D-manno-octulosonic-acid transferase